MGRRAEVLAKSAKNLGRAATFEAHDVTDVEAAEALVARVKQQVGPVQFVNNAAFISKKPAIHQPGEFNAVVQTDVVAAFNLLGPFCPA